MKTETIQLIKMLNNKDKSEIKNWFESFDKKSNSINDWQNLLGFPLEPHSCNICHKIRNKIMSAISHYFGVSHLDNQRFETLGEIYFKEAIVLIETSEPIRIKINDVYPLIKQYLY